jgi:tetratricopeptide (TPR) repeat protein
LETPEDLLKQLDRRFASGEISEESYREVKTRLLQEAARAKGAESETDAASKAPSGEERFCCVDGRALTGNYFRCEECGGYCHEENRVRLPRGLRVPLCANCGGEKAERAWARHGGGAERPGRRFEVEIHEGDQLDGRFTVVREIGRGGMGVVYLAEDTLMNDRVALKVIAGSGGDEDDVTERILHEFRMANAITDYAHVVRVNAVIRTEHRNRPLVLLQMELADGGDLRGWMRENTDFERRQGRGLELFRQACEGVAAIHAAGLAHLDIKPENILIIGGRAKIADFGIGRYMDQWFASNPDQMLKEGVGTPQYMSPEQFHVARQKDIGPASDVYSLGVVLYELLDGSVPFDGKPLDLREKHLTMAPSRLKGRAGAWWPIVSRCLDKDPGERYTSAVELLEDLDRVARGIAGLVDVSCPRCGHLTRNTDARECEDCHADLSARFRQCPTCARDVRFDVEDCPGCGRAVAAYFLFIERKKRVERLKDENPREAIELLELLLREGAGDYEERAVELVRDLRQRQSKISDLISRSNEMVVRGDLEGAIDVWRKVLEEAPRHQGAMEHVEKYESLLEEFNRRKERALELMEQGRHEDAESLLKECAELVPEREELGPLLQAVREKAREYRDLVARIDDFLSRGEIEKAIDQWKKILRETPGHGPASERLRELESRRAAFEKKMKEADRLAVRGEFEGALADLGDCGELIPGRKEVDDTIRDLRDRQGRYADTLEKAAEALKAGELEQASREVESALEVAPESAQGKRVRKKIEAAIRKADELLARAREEILRAAFDEAEETLKEHARVQRDSGAADGVRGECRQKRADFETAMRHVDSSIRQGDLDAAVGSLTKALTVCPAANVAKEKLGRVRADQEKARDLLAGVSSLIAAAEFEKAVAALDRVKGLWPLLDGLEDRRAELLQRRRAYEEQMRLAEDSLARKNIGAAEKAARAALEVCPNAAQASRLVEKATKRERSLRASIAAARDSIRAGDFEKAEALIAEVDSIDPACEDLRELTRVLGDTRVRYREAMDEALRKSSSGDLAGALGCARAALEACPDSKDAVGRIRKVERGMKKAQKLIDDARSLLDEAEFDNARSLLGEAETIWAGADGLDAIRDEAESRGSRYFEIMRSVRDEESGGRLDRALEGIGSALELCPGSVDASRLHASLQKRIARVRAQVGEAEGLIRSADFDQADQVIQQARGVWPDCAELEQLESRLSSVRQQYDEKRRAIAEAIDTRRFSRALALCDEIEQVCPDDPGVGSMRDTVDASRREYQQRRKALSARYRQLAGGAGVILLLGVGGWFAKGVMDRSGSRAPIVDSGEETEASATAGSDGGGDTQVIESPGRATRPRLPMGAEAETEKKAPGNPTEERAITSPGRSPQKEKPRAKPAAPRGSLYVYANQVGGQCYIDGKRVGTGQVPNSVGLAPGVHEVRIVMPGCEPGELVRQVRIEKDKEAQEYFEFDCR